MLERDVAVSKKRLSALYCSYCHRSVAFIPNTFLVRTKSHHSPYLPIYLSIDRCDLTKCLTYMEQPIQPTLPSLFLHLASSNRHLGRKQELPTHAYTHGSHGHARSCMQAKEKVGGGSLNLGRLDVSIGTR